MSSRRLIGPLIIVVFISVAVGEYVGEILNADFYVRYSGIDVGDAALMAHGFLLGCVYVPLIAGSFGAMVSLLGWLAITRQAQKTLRQGFATMAVVFVVTVVVSLLWFAFNFFF